MNSEDQKRKGKKSLVRDDKKRPEIEVRRKGTASADFIRTSQFGRKILLRS